MYNILQDAFFHQFITQLNVGNKMQCKELSFDTILMLIWSCIHSSFWGLLFVLGGYYLLEKQEIYLAALNTPRGRT